MLELPTGPVKLRFGMPANRLIFAKLIEKPDFLKADKINEQGIAFLMHAGYVNACMADNIPETLTFADFYEFVEDNIDQLDTFNMVATCYSNSRHTQKMIDKVNQATEEVKKKIHTSTGTPSNPSATETLD